MRPLWEKIEKEMDFLETEYFDIDENQEEAARFKITNVPTFIFLNKAGGEFLRLQGLQNKEQLLNLIKENLNL